MAGLLTLGQSRSLLKSVFTRLGGRKIKSNTAGSREKKLEIALSDVHSSLGSTSELLQACLAVLCLTVDLHVQNEVSKKTSRGI